MSIQKLHYENISGTLVRREGLLTWRCPLCKAEGQSPGVMHTCPECESKEATLPGAQPEPSEQDASVRKAWARFSHELHRGPDALYPGMADAFEQHFSQSFIDREWRAEAATWAAAWKAAKRHGEQPAPSVPDGFAWPECPKRRQSHVLFDDGYEEGWAACVATIKAALAAPEAKP